MNYQNRRAAYSNFILIFVAIKVALNLVAISNFGFHRDELLHLTLGDHLDWGYKEVPPFIALLAKISMSVFGDSIFASRILTTIASGVIIWLTGLITRELGGRKFAIALACLSMILAPAFAASGYLFQPVVFDQLWWVLAVWLLIKYINTTDAAYLYGVGATVGVGMLTKYTMVFFTVALIIGILISKQRKLLFNRHILGAALLAFIIFLPNLIWQWQHNFPVINHMSELRSTQLEHISAGDFIMQQLLVNGIALFVWLAGFLFLLFSFKLRKFQFLAIGYIL
ncbi:MAG: glycosyltransferase family 39 protein, partial [Sphingobacteriales bacterium]